MNQLYWLYALLTLLVLVIIYVLAGVYRVLVIDTRAYAKFWRELADQPSKKDELTVVALGDSTFQAIGATQPLLGTVGLSADYIEKQTGRPIHINNFSVTGAKAQDVAESQLPQADLESADIVLVAVGANDALKESDLVVFESAIKQICEQLPANKSVMADVALVNHRRPYQKLLAKYRDQAGIYPADLSYSFGMVAQSWRLSARDFFHPSDYGYTFWFKAFQPALDKLISRRLAK
ncbi:MAG TPA: SGNH/GDSL hydrolase family protein [Candidatus Saccharimonadales bacterium]|nr:SGNH/GDSL hydrolase family protein [Candidatus Saccharimonadales bacterium]